jgi:hypothetical protein
MRDLKKTTSGWVHQQLGVGDFAWQEGYSAFTVSAPARQAVYAYIADQENHHRTKTFHEELIELLTRAGIEFNPQYLD